MALSTTDPAAALLSWIQLHDSAFPAGRMVHSHGIEEWLAARPDADAASIETTVVEYLIHGYAPLDATITAAAWRTARSAGRLRELDELTSSYKLFDNTRTASVSTGRQLALTATQIGLTDGCEYVHAVVAGTTAGHAAVVEGAIQGHLDVSLHTATLGSLRSMLVSMLSAAVRLGRLGPLQSQRIQLRNATMVVELAHQAGRRPLSDLSSTAPALDISGMCHKTRTSRHFAS